MQIRVLIKPTVCKCNIFTNRSLLHTPPHLWSPKRNQLHYSFSFLPYSSYQVFKINFPSPHEKKVIGCAEWLRYMSVSVNKQQIGMYDGSLKMLTLFIRKDIFTTCVIIFEEMPPHVQENKRCFVSVLQIQFSNQHSFKGDRWSFLLLAYSYSRTA